MAFFSRYKSAPQLQDLQESSQSLRLRVDLNTPTDEEYTEEDEEERSQEEEIAKGGREEQTTGSCIKETKMSLPEVKDALVSTPSGLSGTRWRRKRLGNLSPRMSALRGRSYDSDLDTVGLETSTSVESAASDSRIIHQTSTDSESFHLGPDPVSKLSSEESNNASRGRITPASSPQSQSRLNRWRKAFKSPQFGRKKAPKLGSGPESSPRLKKSKSEDEKVVRLNKQKSEDVVSWSSKTRTNWSNESAPEMSEWILALGYTDLIVDQEFEVTRISDYSRYVRELLQVTNVSQPEYNELLAVVSVLDEILQERHAIDSQEEPTASLMEEPEDVPSVGDLVLGDARGNNSHNNNNNNNNNNNIKNNNNNNTPDLNLKMPENIEVDFKEPPMAPPSKMSLRRMSAPSALIFKAVAGYRSKNSSSVWPSVVRKDGDTSPVSPISPVSGEYSKVLVLEENVQLAEGLQIRERHLFLFSDLLLVTKQKSSVSYKIKERVPIRDMWTASCIEEVAETTRPGDRSFVIGWPTVNVVVTFQRQDIRDHWLSKLNQLIASEKLKDNGVSIQLKVMPKNIESPCRMCHVSVDADTEARHVLHSCLAQLNILEQEAKDYQLWVLLGKEASPYPLIGHERPLAIKLSHVRGLSSSEDTMTAADLDQIANNSSTAGQRCEFYIKHKKSSVKNFGDSTLSKAVKKSKKSSNIFNSLFRKKIAQNAVFGLPLCEVCDENMDPPESILKLMALVYQQGPHIPGILRRGNKASLSKEIRDKIDCGDKFTLEDHMAPTAASVFKEFLRCIPDGLLLHDLNEEWTSVKKEDSWIDKTQKIKRALSKLPPHNYHMTKLTICLLQHLAKFSTENQMGPLNLATCIAPSLYTHTAQPRSGKLKGEAMKTSQLQSSVHQIQTIIVPLIVFMIVNHTELFGQDILKMFTRFGCEVSPAIKICEDRLDNQRQPSLDEDEFDEELVGDEQEEGDQHSQVQSQQDSSSGTDSDSMHSVLSIPDTGSFRRNNSSTDSLVDREYFSHDSEPSPRTAKSHISPSNLSRDSGLTLSDTQLYDEDLVQDDTMPATRVFQRSASHGVGYDSLDSPDQNFRTKGSHLRRTQPVAPPRLQSSKKRRELEEHQEVITYFSHQAHAVSNPVKHSSVLQGIKPVTHPLLQQKLSNDSVHEEEDDTCDVSFFLNSRANSNNNMLNATNTSSLMPHKDTQHSSKSLASSGRKLQHPFVRQASVTDSTPPVSPQSRYSQSSRDSAISELAYSFSQDESTPHMPDETSNNCLQWSPEMLSLTNIYNSHQRLAHSKSTSDLLSEDRSIMSAYTPRVKLTSPKAWPGRSHEAEEVDANNKNRLTCTLSDQAGTIRTSAHQEWSKIYQSLSFNSGSSPPTTKSTLQDSKALERNIYKVVSSHPDLASTASTDSLKPSMQLEYCKASSKPIIINSAGSNLPRKTLKRATLAKHFGEKLSKRPDKPPSYKDALERSLILKNTKSLNGVYDKLEFEDSFTDDTAPSSCMNLAEAQPGPVSNTFNKNSGNCVGSVSRNSTAPERTQGIDISISEDITASDLTTTARKVTLLRARSNSAAEPGRVSVSRSGSTLIYSSCKSGSSDSPAGQYSSFDGRSNQCNSSGIISSTFSSGLTARPPRPPVTTFKSKELKDHSSVIRNSDAPEKVLNPDNNNTTNSKAIQTNTNHKVNMTAEFTGPSHSSTISQHKIVSSVSLNCVHDKKLSSSSSLRSLDKAAHTPLTSAGSVKQDKPTDQRGSRTEVVETSLVRGRSVSIEGLQQPNNYSSSNTKTRWRPANPEIGLSHSSQALQSSTTTEGCTLSSPQAKLEEMLSEHRLNFQRAKSCFSQTSEEQTLPTASSVTHKLSQAKQRTDFSGQETKFGSRPHSLVSEDLTVESATFSDSRLSKVSKLAPKSDSRSEFHWSVKDLMLRYDKSKDIDGDHINSSRLTTSQTSQSHHPPPFRRNQDSDTCQYSTDNVSVVQTTASDLNSRFSHVTSNNSQQSNTQSQNKSSTSKLATEYSNITYV